MKTIAPLLAVLALVMVSSMAFAGTGLGTSKITLAAPNMSLGIGSSGSVNYNVTLASGNYWGTSINLVNKANLSAEGLSVSFSKGYADPPFNGTMTVSASAATKPGRYAIILNATGDDPSVTNTLFTVYVKNSTASNTTTAPVVVPLFSLFNSTSKVVNASIGASLSIKAPDGKLINVTIPAGTYVKIANKTLSSYNFTLALYTISNLSAPSTAKNDIVAYGFAFLVNGLITVNDTFVNSTGADRPMVTTAQYNSSWTSWTVLGGKQVGTSYVGGNYSFANVWTYNSSKNEIVNTEFFKPVMWVFLIKPASPTTTAPTSVSTTVPSTTPTTISTTAPYTTKSSDAGYYIAAIIVVIVVVIAALAMMRKRK